MNPKISVIIPAYNAEKTIEKCILSIINQTYKNLEVLIINDGSTDNTLDICKEYSDSDDRLIIINNKNHGVSYSRNCGIEMATGDFITFIDSDDYLDRNCYECLLPYMKEDIDFLRYNFKTIGGHAFSNELFELKEKKLNLDEKNKDLLFKHFLTDEEPVPNLVMLLLIRKEIAKKIRFDSNLTMLEDVVFYYNLILISKNVFFSDLKLYNYCVNSDSVTHNVKNYEKNIFGIINTNLNLNQNPKKYLSEDLLKLMNRNHLRIIDNYLLYSYRYDKKVYDKIVSNLKNNLHWKKLLGYFKGTPLKNKIHLIFLKNNLSCLANIYLYLYKKIYLIKKKFK